MAAYQAEGTQSLFIVNDDRWNMSNYCAADERIVACRTDVEVALRRGIGLIAQITDQPTDTQQTRERQKSVGGKFQEIAAGYVFHDGVVGRIAITVRMSKAIVIRIMRTCANRFPRGNQCPSSWSLTCGRIYGTAATTISRMSGHATPHRNGSPSLSSCCTHRKNQGARAFSMLTTVCVMGRSIGAGKSTAMRSNMTPAMTMTNTSRRTRSKREMRALSARCWGGGTATPPSRRTRKMCHAPRMIIARVRTKMCQV